MSVHLSADDVWLTLAMSDQRPGFDTQITHNGTGLQGMLDRMAAVGGTLDLASAVGQATAIRGGAPREAAHPGPQVEAIAAAQAADSDAEPNAALAR